MLVAVTGAAGYVGVNLVNDLLAQGHDVIAVDRQVPDVPPVEGPTWLEADVLEPEQMRKVLDGAEVVYHLVAMITLRQEDPVAWRVNTEGVRTVAEAALEVGARRLVHCSSVHSFDQHHIDGTLHEQSPRATSESGLPVYDRSKYAGELELREVIDQGLDAVICNPTGVYGPVDNPQRLSRVNTLIRDGALGRVPLSIGGGFDLVDVRDVARGLVLAGEHGRTGENYLLGGHMVRMHDVFKVAAKSVGRRGPVAAVPLSVLKAVMPIAEPIGAALGSDVVSEAALGAVLAQPVVDRTKAGTELGYEPRPTEETIRDVVAHLVQKGVLG